VRWECRYLVKVLAPLIGQPSSGRRVRVMYHAFSLEEALIQAHNRAGACGVPVWIELRGASATRRRPRARR